MKVQKTTNYDMFHLRDDNRKVVDKVYLESLVDSIRSKNLLELRPIYVNAKMEVIDGQHRLEACRQIGCDVYYIVDKELESEDIIRLNVNKAWKPENYLNYYVQNCNPHYIEFERFMKYHHLSIREVRDLMGGRNDYQIFRDGRMLFDPSHIEHRAEVCRATQKVFEDNNTPYHWVKARRSTRAIVILAEHPLFNKKTWITNMRCCFYRLSIKPTQGEYLKMYQDVYNYKLRSNKLFFKPVAEKEPIDD